MPRNPQFSFNVSMNDQSAEIGRFSVNTAVPEDMTSLSTEAVDFMLAVNDVTVGLVTQESALSAKKLSNTRIGAGNREDKMMCTYQDNTSLAIYQIDLPTRDNTLATVAGTDYYPLTVAPWINFKTKFEAFVVSPDGNAVTLLSVKLVGRNV